MNADHFSRCKEKVRVFHNKLADNEEEIQKAERASWSYWNKFQKINPFAKKQVLASVEVERRSSLLVEDLFDVALDCDRLSNGDFQKVKQEIWLLAQREERRENITETEIFHNEDFCERWMRWNTTRLKDMMMNYSLTMIKYEEMSLSKRSV